MTSYQKMPSVVFALIEDVIAIWQRKWDFKRSVAHLTVQIVTPDSDHHASFVMVRTLDGEMGILPRHENMIAVLAVRMK